MTKTELQTRLEQCRKDKAAIEAEEKKLLAEIEQQKEVPIISLCKCTSSNDRVIINLTSYMLDAIRTHDVKQIVVLPDGRIGDRCDCYEVRCNIYSNITPIFGSFKPEEA